MQPSSLSPLLTNSLFLQDRSLTVHLSSSLLHTLRSSTALAAETIPSRHLDMMGITLRSASAKLRYVSPSFTVRRSSMSCRFCDTEQRKLKQQEGARWCCARNNTSTSFLAVNNQSVYLHETHCYVKGELMQATTRSLHMTTVQVRNKVRVHQFVDERMTQNIQISPLWEALQSTVHQIKAETGTVSFQNSSLLQTKCQ